MLVAISYDTPLEAAARQLAQDADIPLYQTPPLPDFLLHLTTQGLELRYIKDSHITPLSIDFLAGKYEHRRRFGGGKGQQIAKAIGLNKYKNPTVLDTTAGLGRDAFVLATLGCKVTLLERSTPVFLLLRDALNRAALSTDSAVQRILPNMQLKQADSLHYLKTLAPPDYPDVIYIDPMFPPREKAAKVKKEMALFHTLIGTDNDASQLLELAMHKANKRIAVKRPRRGETLLASTHMQPAFQITGKSTRYDIYLPVTDSPSP